MDLYEVYGSGYGPFLEPFRLPLYKQGLVWVTGDNRDTRSATNNGSGKTHLFKAVGWCLFGESVDGYKGDEVIHEKAKRAEVGVKFGNNSNELWELVRWRTKGTPRLKLVDPKTRKPIPGKREDIQARVIKMLGMDWVSFHNTSLYGQGDVTRFANPRTTDSARKEVLHRVMRSEVFQLCHGVVNKMASDARRAVKEMEDKGQVARDRAAEHDLDMLKKQKTDWDTERDNEITELRDEAKEWRESADDDGGEEAPDVGELKDAIGKLEKTSKAGDEATKKLEKLAKKLKKAGDAVKAAQRVADRAGDVVTDAECNLAKLDGDRCPLCTSKLTEGDAEVHLKELMDAYGEAETEQRSRAHELDEAQAALEALEGEQEGLEEQQNAGRRADKQLTAKREALVEARAAADRAAERRRHALEMTRAKLEQAKRKAAEVNPYATQLDAATSRVKQLISEAEKWDRKAEAKRIELSHLEFWVRGFGNQGLPSFILDAAMPYLTERTNHYLDTLADGDILVEFSTQRELKSAKGEFRDEIDVSWVVEGITNKAPSGGQLKKLDLGTDFGLMDLMATREGGHCNILMLDEVLDGLDPEGRSRVLLLLQQLRAQRGSVFVISHDPDMLEIFEKSVTVVKEGGCSIVQVAA